MITVTPETIDPFTVYYANRLFLQLWAQLNRLRMKVKLESTLFS